MTDVTVIEQPSATNTAPPAEVVVTPVAETAPIETPAEPDWRAEFHGGDPKLQKMLERVTDKSAIGKMLADQDAFINGKLAATIPGADATPEQISAWNKANGVPETPEGYAPKLPDGVQLGDADKAFIGKTLAGLHAKGGVLATPAVVQAFHDLYVEAMDEQAALVLAASNQAVQDHEARLKALWGSEYQTNMTIMSNAASQFFDADDFANAGVESLDEFMGLTLSDGRPLSTILTKALSVAGRRLIDDPLIGAGLTGRSSAISIGDEIAQIESLYVSDRGRYNSPEVQARYSLLLTQQDAMRRKAAG